MNASCQAAVEAESESESIFSSPSQGRSRSCLKFVDSAALVNRVFWLAQSLFVSPRAFESPYVELCTAVKF